ncbi:hypothetical protein M9434_001566 [Picochlorum sp. BPE23]|nr:hypothetical protein M9434_001566 [Picochlorum sp. BPE23]
MISAGCRFRRRRRQVSSAAVETSEKQIPCDWARSLAKHVQTHVHTIVNTVEKCTETFLKSTNGLSNCSGLLLASVSSSTEDQKAVLPSKDRSLDGRLLMDSIMQNASETKENSTDDERIVISEVDIAGVDGELKQAAVEALKTKPNFAYTIDEVRDDVRRVFETGYFSSCRPKAEDTRDGVKLTIEVTPNPELRGTVVTGATRLPQKVIQDGFDGMRGKVLNLNSLRNAVSSLNAWYEKNGVLGQVVDVQMGSDDIARIKVGEATVNRVSLRYIDPETGESREEGKTKPDIILRQLSTRPGQVHSLKQSKTDVEAVYSMGLFEDVSIRPQPAEGSTVENPLVDLTLEVKERKKTGGLAAGGGISAAGAAEGSLPGFVGTVSYSQRNLFGLGQSLSAAAEVGQADSTFRISHTDPWVRGDAFRTSRTILAQSTKVGVAPIHARAADDTVDSSSPGVERDGVFVSRMLGSIEYGRPLGVGWQGSLGLNWQRAKCLNDHNDPILHDVYGGPVIINRGGHGRDTMALTSIRIAYTAPKGDTELLASMEQALPLHRDWLNFNRFSMRADKGIGLGPLKFWASAKGGAIVGDLPPYESFPLGGTNSIRGYGEGSVGSARNYVAGTAEIRFPIVAPLGGTVFADYGTDLGSGATIPGDPAGCRQKPGKGGGIGAGVRVDTPIGPLRFEYAMNDMKHRRFHLGIGNHG